MGIGSCAIPLIIILSAIFDYCALPHSAAIKMANITISKTIVFPQYTREHIGNMRMPGFAENDFILQCAMGSGE